VTTTHDAAQATPSTGGAEPGAAVVAGEPLPDGQVSRRQWVRGAMIAGTVVAAGVGVAACGTSSPNASGPASRTPSGPAPATTTSAAPQTSASATGKTTAPSTSDTPLETPDTFETIHLGKSSTIPVGGGVIYASHGVVVTQPTAGTFKCFSSSCTHLGCTVNKVSAGLILCPCHGAKFSIVDGSVKAGPAPRPLTAQDFSVKDGEVLLD
jgi:Rieske Fe-S protein